MSERSHLDLYQFISRLPLTTKMNIENINPFSVLSDIFKNTSASQLKVDLEYYCSAALSEENLMAKDYPADIIYFQKTIEQIVECCFIIKNGKKGQSTEYWRKYLNSEKLAEYNEHLNHGKTALEVLNSFFMYKNIVNWKLTLDAWLEAAVSNESIIDDIIDQDILGVYKQLERLIDASHILSVSYRIEDE